MNNGEASGPLAGCRVLELGSLIAGPFCGQLLGDFGAEIIKIEDPTRGDPMRQWGSQVPSGVSLTWPIIARNKKSITCNLRDARGQELVRHLAARADVLVENFRPGTLEKWDLGYDALSSLNPRLVMVRITGYGQDGPYAQRAGFGSIGEAMGGIRHTTGNPDRPPSRTGISLGDSLAGTFAAFGAVMALLNRERSGRGQVVDSAIYEAVLALMESLIPEWELAEFRRGRTGSILPGVAPSNVYAAADGSEILIAANSDAIFTRLCDVMELPELATNPRYQTHQARGEHLEELDKLIGEWTVTRPSAELLDRLHGAGVPAGRIYTAADMVTDAHFKARNSIVRLLHRSLGEFPMQNVAPRLSATPGEVRSLGPDLGEHNEAIYGQLLGLSLEHRAQLVADGVI
ncbi:CoA transferase [Frankia sp. AgB1.9]|uniref:CaiB/BaiF CoA transferase family protein n=1 Tax=unclassified Frankia TaxID=2632575 RepID=UPI001931529D|nr:MULTISPECIES: CoA transferase [unclassified Frankia]MBL7488824.1 CoA transferase [Frankia sp. AgW1.1]MBL7546468.1 CoA transferase [Frankia sp. AgB1.9]MBL7620273.1 CoA transferase [Frankia sp. AgB1.8]